MIHIPHAQLHINWTSLKPYIVVVVVVIFPFDFNSILVWIN